MSIRRIGIISRLLLVASTICCTASQDLYAQNARLNARNAVNFQVTDSTERLTLVASDSKVLTMEYDVPFVVVGNPQILKANPVSPNQIMITAITPGVTSLSMTDADNNPHVVEIHVIGDARELQATLETHFPGASLKATAIKTSVLLSGHVEKADDIPAIMQISQAFFPEVVNQLSVGGSQKVMLKVKVVEVSRTKLRKMGIDWSVLTNDFNLITNASGLINAAGTDGIGTIRASVTDGNTNFNLLIDTLEQNNLAKILAEPTLTTMSGRPAGFLNGGEVPVPINTGLGVQSVEFQPFGTKLDFVPIVLGNGRLRLEVRPEVRELAGDLRDPVSGAPGFRTRRVDTGVEMQVGHTLALAGLIQNRVDSQERGLPILKDLPWIGAAFRRVEETYNEVELVVLVTPYFIHEVDECVLPTAPGRSTVTPNDNEFYWKGYREVPSCGNPYELGPLQGAINSQADLYQQQQPLSLPQAENQVDSQRRTVEYQPLQNQNQNQNQGQHSNGMATPQNYPPAAPKQSAAPANNLPLTQNQNVSYGSRTTLYPGEKPAESTGTPNYDFENAAAPATEPAVTPEKRTRYFPRPSLFGIGE